MASVYMCAKTDNAWNLCAYKYVTTVWLKITYNEKKLQTRAWQCLKDGSISTLTKKEYNNKERKYEGMKRALYSTQRSHYSFKKSKEQLGNSRPNINLYESMNEGMRPNVGCIKCSENGPSYNLIWIASSLAACCLHQINYSVFPMAINCPKHNQGHPNVDRLKASRWFVHVHCLFNFSSQIKFTLDLFKVFQPFITWGHSKIDFVTK